MIYFILYDKKKVNMGVQCIGMNTHITAKMYGLLEHRNT